MTPTTPQPGSDRGERWAGIFVLGALLLLVAGFAYYLYHTAERKGWLVPRCPYYTFVQSADGLAVGDPVKMMGFDIGAITTIEAQPPGAYYNVFVGVEVKRPYYGYIWSDSKIKVANVGLLGRQLEITKGVTGAPTVRDKHNKPDEILLGTNFVALAAAPKGVFLLPDESASVTERAEKLLATAEAALPDILALTNRLNLVLDNANVLVTNGAVAAGNANALITNATLLVTELRPAVSNLTARLDHTLEAVDTNLVTLAGNLNATLMNLASLTGNLNSQVASNDQILTGISTLVRDTDELVQGLKKHWLLRGAFSGSKTNMPPTKK